MFADLIGKGAHVRTVPVPASVEGALTSWTSAAQVSSGAISRAINKAGRIADHGFSPKVIWGVVKKACADCGLAPHDLRTSVSRSQRRTGSNPISARPCQRSNDGTLHRLQARLRNAVNDAIGLERPNEICTRTTSRGRIWASINNVQFRAASRTLERSSRSRKWAVCTTVMNVLHHSDVFTDPLLAKHRLRILIDQFFDDCGRNILKPGLMFPSPVTDFLEHRRERHTVRRNRVRHVRRNTPLSCLKMRPSSIISCKCPIQHGRGGGQKSPDQAMQPRPAARWPVLVWPSH